MFQKLYQSPFSGLIKQELFDNALENMDDKTTWYEIVLDTSPVEVTAIDGSKAKERLLDWVSKVEKRGHHSRLDWFYADGVDSPQMIKVYNPLKCGCSGGKASVPWMVFTTVKPSEEELKPFEKPPKGLVDNLVCRLKTIRNFMP
jgi:hypothetical protein